MKTNFVVHKSFLREVKRLKKRYASINADLEELKAELADNPFAGADLGKGVRKVRMRIASKGKGKSGGARVITCNVIISVNETEVNLLYIYDKSEQESISPQDIASLLEQNELNNNL